MTTPVPQSDLSNQQAVNDSIVTPPTNRGVTTDQISLSCDWFTCSFSSAFAMEFIEYLCEITQTSYTPARSSFPYTDAITSSEGWYMAYTETQDQFHKPSIQGDCKFEMHGAFLQTLSYFQLANIWRKLKQAKAYCTRFDIALDDYSKPVKFEHREPEQLPPFRNPCVVHVSNSTTYTWGKRGKIGGGTQIVIYDKASQSDGVIDSHRVEVRHFKSRDKAQNVWDMSFEMSDIDDQIITTEWDYKRALFHIVNQSADWRAIKQFAPFCLEQAEDAKNQYLFPGESISRLQKIISRVRALARDALVRLKIKGAGRNRLPRLDTKPDK